MEKFKEFVCPKCKMKLQLYSESYRCSFCEKNFPIKEDIPIFILNEELTEETIKVQKTYDDIPLETIKNASELNNFRINLFAGRIDEINYENIIPHLKDNIKILEVGCGEGNLLKKIKIFPEDNIFALDYSYKSILVTKKKRDSIRFLQADARFLPFPDEFFDIIICSEVLEHIPAYQDVLKELFRVIKFQGICSISVPNSLMIFYPLPFLAHIIFKPAQLIHKLKREMNWSNYYDRPFLPWQLKEAIGKIGFKLLFYRSSNIYIGNFENFIIDFLEKININLCKKIIKLYFDIGECIFASRLPVLKYLGTRQYFKLRKEPRK